MRNIMKRVGEVTIATNLNPAVLKDGKRMVRIRAQFQGASRYYTTHMSMTQEEYIAYCKKPSEEHDVTRQFNRFFDAAIFLVKEENFTFANLLIQTSRSKANSLQEQIQFKINALKEDKKWSTAIMYNDLLTAVNGYLKDKKIPIGKVTQDFCISFMNYLQNVRKNGPTTISIRMRGLSCIMQEAIQHNLVKKNPVKSVKIPQYRRRNLDIKLDTLTKLLTATRQQVGKENFKWLNYWRAQYYANGINVTDLLRLKRSNFIDGEIVFIRKKTFHTSCITVHVPFTKELNDALNEICGGKTYILPDLDGVEPDSQKENYIIKETAKKINEHMAEIYDILEIKDKKTVTYTARHTFATRLLRCGVPIEFVSNAMGHTNIRTTQNYFDGYTPEQRIQTAKLLRVTTEI